MKLGFFGSSYVRCRKQSGIVGRNGHHGVITAQLIELHVYQLHEYVWIFFKFGTEGPVRVLWLWGWAADLPYGFSQFLPHNGKVNTYDKECGKNGSKEI